MIAYGRYLQTKNHRQSIEKHNYQSLLINEEI